MATSTQTLAFNIVGRDVSGGRALSSLGREAEVASGKFGALGTQMATFAKAGALAGLAGVGYALKTGFGEVKDYEAGLAQLQAGIKSTGGAAGLTATQMESLASNIQGYSGQTDDSIVKSESLLQTFTNIRDVAGENNDIFTRATKATADMAAKFGGDASSQAIKLGKALNDPVKGLTALTKIGVSFTEQQSAQVKAMVASGNVLGAQKVILAELTKETGGAARAFGETLPGRIEKMKRSFEDASQELVTALLPAFEKIVSILQNDVIPAFAGTVHFIQENSSWIKPLAIAIGVAVAAWKAYTLAANLAAAANLALGRSAPAAAAGAAAGSAASSGGRLAAAKAIPVIGTLVAGATFAKGVTDAGNERTQQAFIEQAQQGGKALADMKAESDRLGEALKHQGGIQALVTQKTKDAMDAAIASTGATDKDTGAKDKNTSASQRLAAATSNLTDKITKQANALLASSGSYDGFRKLLNDLPGVVKENGTALKGYSDKAIANRDALRQLGSSILQHVADLKEQGKSAGTVNRSLVDMEKQLRAQAIAQYGSKDAVDAFLKKLHLLPGQTKQALAGLGEAGRSVGIDFGQGLVDGIHSKDGAVRQAAQYQASQLEKYARLALQTGSPSKVAIRVGEDWTGGLILGVGKKAKHLYNVAAALADGIANGFNYGLQQIVGELGGHLQYVLQGVEDTLAAAIDGIHEQVSERIGKVRDRLGDRLGDINDALRESLSTINSTLQSTLGKIDDGLSKTLESLKAGVDAAHDQLRSLLDARDQMAAGIASSTGALNLGSLFGTDETGKSTMGNVGEYLAGKLAALRKLAEDIKSLRAAGLAGPLLADIVSLPVDQATQVAEQILSGAAGAIGDLNATQADITGTSQEIGGTVAGANFDQAIAEQTAVLLKMQDTAERAAALAEAAAEQQRQEAREDAREARQEARQEAQQARQEAREHAQDVIAAIRDAGREQVQRVMNLVASTLGALPRDANAKEIRQALLELKKQIGALGLA